MTLDDLLAGIAPLLEGQATLPEAAEKLYGAAWRDSADAQRLSIYAAFCAQHRLDALTHVYADTRRAIVAEQGEAAWERIVARYFLKNPMHHVELNENGVHFSTFIRDNASELAPWLPELADFEWWEWQTRNAARDGDERAGPLRLSKTVEARPYHFDFVGWLEGSGTVAPESVETLVIFWRDRDDDTRRENLCAVELAVIAAVVNGAPLEARDQEAIDDLSTAGILVGSERT
jgi:hypothetical protein